MKNSTGLSDKERTGRICLVSLLWFCSRRALRNNSKNLEIILSKKISPWVSPQDKLLWFDKSRGRLAGPHVPTLTPMIYLKERVPRGFSARNSFRVRCVCMFAQR